MLNTIQFHRSVDYIHLISLLLASHDKHEPRKSRDGERFRSAAEASFQLDGVSRSVSRCSRLPFEVQRAPRRLTA